MNERPTTGRRLRDVAMLSASCAVIAGSIEAAVTGFRKVVLYEIMFVSYDFVWMTPTAFLLLVVPASLAGGRRSVRALKLSPRC